MQHGQIFELKTTGSSGQRLWAYRYRLDGRDSRRIQLGGYASADDARAALQRALTATQRRKGRVRVTLDELAEGVSSRRSPAELGPCTDPWCCSRPPPACGPAKDCARASRDRPRTTASCMSAEPFASAASRPRRPTRLVPCRFSERARRARPDPVATDRDVAPPPGTRRQLLDLPTGGRATGAPRNAPPASPRLAASTICATRSPPSRYVPDSATSSSRATWAPASSTSTALTASSPATATITPSSCSTTTAAAAAVRTLVDVPCTSGPSPR
jgi:hypothetical protein